MAYVTVDRGASTMNARTIVWGLTSAPSGVAIHGGAIFGGNAPVLQALDITGVTSGNNFTVALAPATLAAMLSGLTYIAVQTGAFPAGEVRGHICLGNCALAVLTPYQEYRYTTPASGLGALSVNNSAGVPLSEYGTGSVGYGVAWRWTTWGRPST